ncbi:MAG: purple acid phosphatase [Deltaproteobacteria bacterium]|nr:purple acid phosphatase [Deltaproteobacteria bacterium]
MDKAMRRAAKRWIGVAAGVAALATLGAGCLGNVSGDTSATKVGDVSNPPAERGRPGADIEAACGNGRVTDAGTRTIRRAPYLQDVTHRSAALMWTTAGNGEATVEVTTPSGEQVATVPARVETSARPLGARQLVSEIAGLAVGTLYCYQVREGDLPVTERGGFRTAPAMESDGAVRFVALGDSGGGGEDQVAVLSQLESVPFDLMLHVGDVAYDEGTRTQFETRFFDMYSHLLSRIPIFPESGNHEYKTDEATPFREVFRLPENGGPNGRERWFSFNWGSVHFVGLDTERTGPEQAAWLEADLAANERPWVIVYGHKPPYSSGEHGSDSKFRQYFVPILERFRVPLVLTGHDHNYERTKPIGGVTYIVTGGGGVGTRTVGTSSYTAFSEQVLHFVYVTIHGNKLALHAIDGTGKEFDSAVIERGLLDAQLGKK